MAVAAAGRPVRLSLVIPCYNEEAALPASMPPLIAACAKLGVPYELVMVNNGSWDATPQKIDEFIAQGLPVKRVDVPVNRGFGWGVICGLRASAGDFVGYACADGQVSPEDILNIYQAVVKAGPGAIAKARRVRRQDGGLRGLTSWGYNALFTLIYGRITPDVNGVPKFLAREDLARLDPLSPDSFIDPELMIKARILGMKITEVPVTFLKRQGGRSTVRVLKTSIEFVRNLLGYRRRADFREWRRKLDATKGVSHAS
jgi:glycosyltransferase involved in cell wall biosynthesis